MDRAKSGKTPLFHEISEMSEMCQNVVSEMSLFRHFFRQFSQFSFQTQANPHGRSLFGQNPEKPEKTLKNGVFRGFLAILSISIGIGKGFWTRNVSFDRKGPYGPTHRTLLTGRTKTPYQTPWDVSKSVKICQKYDNFRHFSVCQVSR